MTSYPHDGLRALIGLPLWGEQERPAIEFEGFWYTRSDVQAMAEQIEQCLVAGGLPPTAGVALVTRNRIAHAAAVLGLLAAQRCVVVLSGTQAQAKLAADVRALRPAAVVADDQDWTPALVDAASETGAMGVALFQQSAPAARRVGGLERMSDAPHHRTDPETVIEMLTSGTTGTPKRVAIARDAVRLAIDNALQSAKATSAAAAPQINYYPLGHLSGLHYLLLAWCDRRPLVLLERFELEAFRRAIRVHRPTTVAMPPAVLRTVLEAQVPREEFASVTVVRSGTAPLDPELQQRFEDTYGMPVLVSYGATEFWVVLTTWTLDDHRRFGHAKRGSVGRPASHVQVRAADPASGTALAAGGIGLLEARVDGVAEWTRTTDLGRVDDDGFVFLHGRADDAINRGGFKVSAGKIAGVLRACPGVVDAAVVGIADDRLGQVPVAAVELSGPAATVDDVERHARGQLASYEIPARILVVDALPRTQAMKVSMPDVRALFETAAPAHTEE